MPFNVLASSACTFATSFAPAAWRSAPSRVTAALTELAKTLNGMDHGALQRALSAIK